MIYRPKPRQAAGTAPTPHLVFCYGLAFTSRLGNEGTVLIQNYSGKGLQTTKESRIRQYMQRADLPDLE